MVFKKFILKLMKAIFQNERILSVNRKVIAHVRSYDSKEQSLEVHLREVEEISGKLASKIGLKDAGRLIGLMHDFGKYSSQFQTYIQSATGILNPDIDDDYVDAVSLKGKIDHSSAGAQWIWERLEKYGSRGQGRLCGQILSLCIASHHSGLIDCLKPDGEQGFLNRMSKDDGSTHLKECRTSANPDIIATAENLASVNLIQAMLKQINQFFLDQQHGQIISQKIKSYYLGFWTKILFSCLIDADRISSADFENPRFIKERIKHHHDWQTAISRFESFTQNLCIRNRIDEIRKEVSSQCHLASSKPQGIFSLTVPTGGGKTYASLRFALHHAAKHKLDRIIYVIPYTSIIEQNAEAVRLILENKNDPSPWVLEHHSNLEPEQQTWRSKLMADNWDSPIIFTTMVQFLETLFSGGTRGARRLHQLINSVIIFDEIQTLPINCIHLFCNSINYLAAYGKASILLCTATQPLLNKLKNPENGQLHIPPGNEIINNKTQLFKNLKRVDIKNKIKPGGWSADEILKLMLKEHSDKGNCLVIVNTKAWAQKLTELAASFLDENIVFHLSTNQCSAHRKKFIRIIKERLKNNLPVLCISTQLIEAGVDIDFASVIRFLAGLDSIVQATGRCNRNGYLNEAVVHVINPNEENIEMLADIKEGRDIARRVLSEDPEGDPLAPDKMEKYFHYYFYARAHEMTYKLSQETGRTDNLLNLLSDNTLNPVIERGTFMLRQSFMTAGRAFKAIDAPTHSVIVPFEEGDELITKLCAVAKDFDAAQYYKLLRAAQRYSVNVFPQVWRRLAEQNAIYEIQAGEGIYYLDKRFYSEKFGLSTEVINPEQIMVY